MIIVFIFKAQLQKLMRTEKNILTTKKSMLDLIWVDNFARAYYRDEMKAKNLKS